MTISNSKNELETNLVAAQTGDKDITELILTAQVFMPVRDNGSIADCQKSNKAEPLILKGEGEAEFKIMPIFSSPEQAKEFLKNFKQYSGGLLVSVNWILSRIRQNMGISINPGSEPGIDLDPATIKQLVTLNALMENTEK